MEIDNENAAALSWDGRDDVRKKKKIVSILQTSPNLFAFYRRIVILTDTTFCIIITHNNIIVCLDFVPTTTTLCIVIANLPYRYKPVRIGGVWMTSPRAVRGDSDNLTITLSMSPER